MKNNRLSPTVVWVVGTVLCIAAIAGIYFGLLKPTQEQIDVAQGRYDAAYPDSTPQQQALAQKGLEAANQYVQTTQHLWAIQDAKLMPRFDVSNRFLAWKQLTYELTQSLGPSLERHSRSSGVHVTTAFSLPAPPVNPNDITNAPVVVPLGTITDVGDFRSLLTHVYNWQFFNRLVLIDNLALHGNSPFMQGTYTATIYFFPQNDTKLPPPIPAAGTGTAATGAPLGATAGPGIPVRR